MTLRPARTRARRTRAFQLLARLALAALALPGPLAAVPRLGEEVVPTFEAVRLRLDPARQEYGGTVAVDLDVRRPTREVRFHARGQRFTRLALTRAGQPVAVEVERARGEEEDEGYTVARAAAPLAPGAYRLEIDFTQAFNTRAVALYRAEKDGRSYAFTQFEATDARGAFPCWDEPGFKIPWQVAVEIPAALAAVSNTRAESERTAGGKKIVTFARTPPLPSYLLALAVGPFDFTPIPGLSVPGRVVSPAGQGRLAGLAARSTPALLQALERYFGQPYPFAKLDLIAVPEFWPGAMENPGAVTFADSILLADPRTETAPEERSRLLYVTAHELAHMWFGDLVTMRWWDDLWLNESFADWMAVKIVEEVEPGLETALKELQDVQGVMESDARPSAQAIHQPTDDPAQAVQQVGVVYNKGKAVLAMFESWLGPETFRRGVIDYLRSRAWGNAVAADFWSALERASGDREVSAALAGFLDQPGLPLVTVEPLPGGRLRLSQRRFLSRGATAPPLGWTIPVGLKVSDGRSVHTLRVLLGPAGREVEVPGLAPGAAIAWVMPNLAGAGYYRWRVPDAMLPALSGAAVAVLDERERIALAGNLGALFEAGLLRGDRYLAALSSLAADPEPAVVGAVLASLRELRPLVPDRLSGAFAAHLRRTLAPALARFGAEPRPGEPPAVALMRPDLLRWLGEEGRDEAVRARAREQARRVLADPAALEPELAETALRLAAADGDRALFGELRRRFERARSPDERRRYLAALGAFREPALVQEALRYSLTGPLRPNERFQIPLAISRQGERSRQQVFEWLLAHYDRVAASLPPVGLAYLPRTAEGCSAERLARAQEFFGKLPYPIPGLDRQLAQIADRVTLCVALRESEGPAIAAYLEEEADRPAGEAPAVGRPNGAGR